MDLDDLCDSLFDRLFYKVDWPIQDDQVHEILADLDFEGTSQVQAEMMVIFGEGIFSSFDVKEILLKALEENN